MAASLAEQSTSQETAYDQAVRELHEMWRSPADLPGQREYFEKTVQEICGETMDPTQGRLLAVGADYLRWLLFAKQGDALPDTLALAERKETHDFRPYTDIVIVNPDTEAAKYGIREVIDRFIELSRPRLTPLLEERTEAVPITALLNQSTEVVKASPVYGLLESFTEEPPTDNHTRPLNQDEKRVQEAIARQEIERRYGLGHGEAIAPRTQADLALRKRVLQLDDERVPTKGPKPTTAAERARDYFVNEGIAVLRERGYENVTVSYGDRLQSHLPVSPLPIFSYTSSHGSDKQEHRDGFATFGNGRSIQADIVDRIIASQGNRGKLAEMNDRTMLYDVISKLDGLTPWSKVLDDCATSAAVWLARTMNYQNLATLSQTTHGLRDFRSAVFDDRWTEILLPVGQMCDSGVLERPTRGVLSSSEAKYPMGTNMIGDYAGEEKASRQLVAEVARNSEARADTKSRLMIIDGTLPPLPLSVQGAALQITFKGERYINSDKNNVLIPGYELVAANTATGVYQFIKAEVDPYDVPNIPLNDVERVSNYVREYTPFTSIAERITAEQPNLSRLAQIISQESDYTYDTSLEPGSGLKVPEENGRPQLQCTGANNFLASVINLSDMPLSAEPHIAAGYVIDPGQGEINGVRHAQLVVPYQGASYMLDATPGGRDASPGAVVALAEQVPVGRAARRSRIKQHLKNRKDSRRVRLPDIKLAISDIPKSPPAQSTEAPQEPVRVSLKERRITERKQQDTNLLRDRLEMQLLATFHVPNRDALMRQLIKQPKEDPVRKTLAVALQSTSTDGVTDDIEALKKYLANYHKLTAQQRKQYRLFGYNQQTLQMLATYVDDLSATL